MLWSLPNGRMNDGSTPTMAQLMDLLILRSGERSVTNSSENKIPG